MAQGSHEDMVAHGRKRLLPFLAGDRLSSIDEDRVRAWLVTMGRVALPARVVTTLRSGKLVRRGKHSHIARVVRADVRQRIALAGRLTTPGGNPLADVPVEVLERVSLPETPWRQVGSIRTSTKGRFNYRAAAGPNASSNFAIPGRHAARRDTLRANRRPGGGHDVLPIAASHGERWLRPIPRATP